MTTHGSVTIVYDGDGNRVSETAGGVITKYLVDNLNPTGLPQVLDELVNGSVTRTYAYGSQRISENQLVGSTWTPSFYGYDGHGNVRFLTNTAGAVTDTYQYDAFGMPIASTGTTANNFRYSDEWLDSSIGLYHLRARYYNQATGRFWVRDPVEGARCSPLSYNPYIYTWDNPINRIDPTGRASDSIALPRPAPGSEYLGLLILISFAAVHPLQQLGQAIGCKFELAASYVHEFAQNIGHNSLKFEQNGPCGVKEIDQECYLEEWEPVTYPVHANKCTYECEGIGHEGLGRLCSYVQGWCPDSAHSSTLGPCFSRTF